MKRWILAGVALVWLMAARPATAEHRFILRNPQGRASSQDICSREGCSVVQELDDHEGQVFLVSVPDSYDPKFFLGSLRTHPEVVNAELDQVVALRQNVAGIAPAGLRDSVSVDYFGGPAWHGYVDQPASHIIRLEEARSAFSAFKVTGSGIVAVIDTGVDPRHPALQNVVVPGYNFLARAPGGAPDLADLNQSTMALVDQTALALVNQSTMAVVDQTKLALLRDPKYAALGHGTMVAGIIHLVAPTALIMPLKAFDPDGTAYLSRILQAVYYAAHHGANVINMSFDFPHYSREMLHAVNFAYRCGVVCVASVGNDGKEELVYPAGYVRLVMGVASTNDEDVRSWFSNYGEDLVVVAAPGEAIISTFAFQTYAAGWGTSFSAPFVSGAVALFRQILGQCTQNQAIRALSHAHWISEQMGYGRINLFQAVTAVMKRGKAASSADAEGEW